MIFTGKKGPLLNGLQTISGAVADKSTLPILTNIILETQDSSLKLVGTDLEVSIETTVSATIQQNGSCTIPARRLRRLVNELPSSDTKIHFELTDGATANITVEETSSSFTMNVLDREEYPDLPGIEEGTTFETDLDDLKHIFDHTSFAAGTDTSRSYLCGVYLDIDGTDMTVVATDAHRLALHETSLRNNDQSMSLLVPTKASKELTKILRNSQNDTLRITTDQQLVKFTTENTKMISRLIDEEFPDYDQVIPQDYEKRIVVDRTRFLDAVKRVSLMADEKTRRLVLELEPSRMTVQTEASEEGGGEEVLGVEYSGDQQTIAFNGDYLQDVLQHIEDDEVHFDLISEDSPGTFRPMDDGDFLYIIMPLRLN